MAILGTSGTVRSGAIARELSRLDSRVEVIALACPLLVPLIENGYVHGDQPLLREALKVYLPPVASSGADVVILGCTHFPLIAGAIREVLPGVALVDSGREVARETARILQARSLSCGSGRQGRREYFITDIVDNFQGQAERFLGRPIQDEIQQVELH